jgi:paraquat-inducible protein A
MSESLRQRFPGHFEIPVLLMLSSLLLGAGLCMPLMNVEKMMFWNNDYSVLTGITGLFKEKEYFLSAILFFFCLVFPITKLCTLWFLWLFKCQDALRARILEWLTLLGKWSMLDVFVVAILIVAVKLGPMANVEPRQGVYIFSVAIILSIVTSTWIEGLVKKG